MPYSRKIVLSCPNGYSARLEQLVAQFVSDGVIFVGVVGKDCAKIGDIIDDLVVGDGSRERHFIHTSSHPSETLEEVVEFASSLRGEEYSGEVQIVEL